MIQIDMPMPDNCLECRFSISEFGYCNAMPVEFVGQVSDCEEDGKPEWCPLKAQEPRVMTLGEIGKALKMPLWKETKSANKYLYTGWVLAYDIQKGEGITGTRLGMSEPSGRVVWYRLDDYGKTWRCWTSRPDEKRRAETLWN